MEKKLNLLERGFQIIVIDLYSLDNSYEYFYEELVDLNGKIIGIVIEKFLKYIIIKLETGSYIKTILFQNTVNKGGFYFINDLNVIKSLMIDEYIWLKYSKNYYIKINHDLTHNYLIAQNSILPNFKKI